MGSRFRLIHIRDPDDGQMKPLFVKSYRKIKDGGKLMLTKSELVKNAKKLDEVHGGWIGTVLGAVAPMLLNPLLKKIGLGLNIGKVEQTGGSLPDKGLIKDIILSSANKLSKQLHGRKGGRIYLGQGIKMTKRRIFGTPYGMNANESSIANRLSDSGGALLEAYNMK